MAKRINTDRERILLDAFWMPSVQTMVSRKSSITNAFVNSILPILVPSPDEIETALSILKMEPTNLRCSYCSDKASEWDHLRPIVVNMRPTGFISEIANLVPSCGKCNQSKRNEDWKTWMLSEAATRSPTARKLPFVSDLIGRLETYVAWKPPTRINFDEVLGKETHDKYWSLWEKINVELRDCQNFANGLRSKVIEALGPRFQ